MVTINLNFNNFSGLSTLLEVFGSFDNNYEYTAEGIFRRKAPPFCPRCNSPMVHNGVPLQKIWLFYKTSEKHHKWDIYMS